EYERLLVADRAAARCSRNRAVDREPRHRNRDARGLALYELRDLAPVLRIEDVLLRLELGPEPCFDDIGPRFDEILAHCDRASVLPSSHLTASCGELNFGASARTMITLQRWPGERPVLATRSIGATLRLVVATTAGMSPR